MRPARLALVQVKSNLGPLAPSMGYTMNGTGSFSWTGPARFTPEDLLTDGPIGAGLPRRKLVAEWLRQNLLDGRRSQYNSIPPPSVTASASQPCGVPSSISASLAPRRASPVLATGPYRKTISQPNQPDT
jgi:hypothetical protein